MTLGPVCELHAHPHAQLCHDCGSSAWHLKEGWRVAHEDFYVHDELWGAVCPDDEFQEWTEAGESFREGSFVLCIGCFEERLGRHLTKEDFTTPPRRHFGVPPSYRFRSRWKARAGRDQSGAGERI